MVTEARQKVKEYLQLNHMICEGEHVCVAVSGGADSMCLLFLMKELSEETGFTVSAVHVEHGIRGEASLSDMEYVREQCVILNIPLDICRTDAVTIAARTGATLEEAARNERYRIFDEIQGDKIALAHHMNDQAETVLFNLIRGTGIRGLRGITPVRGRYIRPLLCLNRQEIEAYCHANGICYRHDATNNDTGLSRNRIRLNVIPELEIINDSAVEHICDSAAQLSEAETLLEALTDEAADDCTEYDRDMAVIDINKLEGLHPALASRVIKKALVYVSGRAKDIGRKHINAALLVARGQSGRQAALIYGIKVRKEFRKLLIAGSGYYERTDTVPVDMPRLGFDILNRRKVSDEDILNCNGYTKYIDYAKIKDTANLAIRHRQPGDRISIRGGSKKLKDLLIEEQLPIEKRDRIFVIALGSDIVWVPELGRLGERYKVTEETDKILRMEIIHG